jgi:hypothetical protein
LDGSGIKQDGSVTFNAFRIENLGLGPLIQLPVNAAPPQIYDNSANGGRNDADFFSSWGSDIIG